MPGRIQEVLVTEGMSVREVVQLAGFEADGYTITMDAEAATLDSIIKSSTNLIALAKSVKGA